MSAKSAAADSRICLEDASTNDGGLLPDAVAALAGEGFGSGGVVCLMGSAVAAGGATAFAVAVASESFSGEEVFAVLTCSESGLVTLGGAVAAPVVVEDGAGL
jgi:hypothetical protein